MRSSLFTFSTAALLTATVAGDAYAQASRSAKQASAADAPATTPQLLTARSIGPAVMGGRVAAIAIDPKTPTTFYVGAGMGSLFKTTDNGITFSAIFEHEKANPIGAVAVSPSDPQVVWVGTGEANDRNSVGWGNGVYRSTNGGSSWTHVGLDSSKTIARIAVNPTDAKTAYVAAMGNLWMPNSQRGLYKTSDGGATWKKVLSAPAPYDNRVGAGDVAVDPSNPNIVYAALYARQRRPWAFTYGPAVTDGKDLGGIFKSTDGGATWRKLTNGLPSQTGRIGLSVFAKDPRIVYAVVQSDSGGQVDLSDPHSKAGGVFRSDDGGEHWTRTSPLNPRPFYFSQIRVDPTDSQHVYLLAFILSVSEDGGHTWREDRFNHVHPDSHALQVDPTNPKHILIGTDGGIFQSFNAGATWDHLNKIAIGEFYRINVDNSTPFRICGGLQDNTNWVGPSATRSQEGIRNGDWTTLQGGDGSYCAFDPTDPSVIYRESQQGDVKRIDLKSGQTTAVRPTPNEGADSFRFNWLAPLIMSKHEPGTLYMGGNVVFKLTNQGEHWQVISPDLSTKDFAKMQATGSGAETYGTLFTIAESPVKAGMLWVGTDDGKVWKTVDDGAHWTDLTAKIPTPARGHWVNRIEAGHAADANTAYVAINAQRDAIYTPFLYRTTDGGTTWQNIAGNLPSDEPVRLVREDPLNPNVLYAGTERGLWITLDGGKSWSKFGKLPTIAVSDIVIEPKTHSIVVATQGRSLYVIDDARPIAELTPAVLNEPLHLFAPDSALEYVPLPTFGEWTAGGEFRASNPPFGAILTYYVKDATGDGVTINIAKEDGIPVATLKGPAVPGLNRVAWNLRITQNHVNSYGGAEGTIFVHPGTYKVTVSYGKEKSSQTLKVNAMPGIETK